jgi:hypothetical protein
MPVAVPSFPPHNGYQWLDHVFPVVTSAFLTIAQRPFVAASGRIKSRRWRHGDRVQTAGGSPVPSATPSGGAPVRGSPAALSVPQASLAAGRTGGSERG